MGVMLAATLTLTNCAKEMTNPVEIPSDGTPFEIFASTAETRTINDGMATKWEAGDTINLFHAVTETADYINDGKYIIAEEDLEDGRFTGELTGELSVDGVYDWYAFFPYLKKIESPVNTTGYAYIGHSKGLNQDGYGSKAALKRSVCPLYGIAKAVKGDKVPSITMQHLSSVVAINVVNDTETPLKVTTASLTAEESIVGSYYIDFSGDPKYTDSGANYVFNTATVNVSNATELAKGESAVLYLAIKPFTAKSGSKLILSVNGYPKEMELSQDVTFHAGKIKPVNFKYDYVPKGKTATFDFTSESALGAMNVAVPEAGVGTEISNMTLTVGEISMTSTDGSTETRVWKSNSGALDLRVYKNGGSISFDAPDGYAISKITMTGYDLGYLSADGYSNPDWTGNRNKVTFTASGTAKIKTVEVVYDEGEGDDPETPKTEQILSFPEASYSVIMGESFTAPTVSGAKTTVTYTSSNEDVATVSANGNVTLVGVGSTVITATAESDETYASGSASYTLNVSPAPSSEVLSLPWTEDFSNCDLSAYTIGNGSSTTQTKIFQTGDMYAGGTAPEVLIAKSGGFLSAKITTGGYTGVLTFTFKSNHADYLEVTSETEGIVVYKNSDTEYIINISQSMASFVLTLTNVKSSNARVDDISLVKGGTLPEEEPTPSETYTFKKVTTITSGKSYLIVANGNVASPVSANKTYGYLYVESAVPSNGEITQTSMDNAFVIGSISGGYTIQQADGRYLYQSGTYTSFNVDANPTEGHIWTVSVQSDGTVKITNNSTNKFIQYSEGYSSYGSYADEQGLLPELYELAD